MSLGPYPLGGAAVALGAAPAFGVNVLGLTTTPAELTVSWRTARQVA
jgi:hypothetical protein